MYKSKKMTALFLAFVMMFSFAINPISAVYGSAPIPPKLTPGKVPEGTKASETKSEITVPPTSPFVPSTPKLPDINVKKPAKLREEPGQKESIMR